MVSPVIISCSVLACIFVAYHIGKKSGSTRTENIFKDNTVQFENKIKSLVKTTENQKQEIESLMNNCRILEDKNFILQKELSNFKSAHNLLIDRYSTQIHKNKECEKTYKQLYEKYDKLCEDYENLNANYNEILQNLQDKEQSSLFQLKYLLDENSELSSMVDGLDTYSNLANKEIRDKNDDIAQLIEQRDEIIYQYNELRLTRFQNLVQNSILYPYVKDSFVYEFMNYAPLAQQRLFNYLDDQKNHPDYKILSIDVCAKIRGSKNNIYQTTLNSCTCPDYRKHSDISCKHMYRLAHLLALFNDLPSKKIDKEIRDLKKVNEEYKRLTLLAQKITGGNKEDEE